MQSGISFNVPSDDRGELARARTMVGLEVTPPASERLSPIKILILPWDQSANLEPRAQPLA
jgi:hypothetical protein